MISSCNLKQKQKYTYAVPLLGNEIIGFEDDEPDISIMRISHLDADINKRCNLRCSYCFKGNLSGKQMSLETAKQSIRFLCRYSGDTEKISIAFLGGEPMLSFGTIKEFAPWAYTYCSNRSKNLVISFTTNGTVFSEEHHDFFRKWHLGLHLSFDGCPEVQDYCRKFADGRGSSKAVESNLPRIFSAWRTVYARSTIVPSTVKYLADSYAYFCKKGFLKVFFALANGKEWEEPDVLETLSNDFSKVLDCHWNFMKETGKYIVLEPLERYVRSMNNTEKVRNICGAGQGSLNVDVDGSLWACHRFSSSRGPHKNLILGSVWGGFSNKLRNCFMNMNPCTDYRQKCGNCSIQRFCSPGCIAANWQENGDIYDIGKGYCLAAQTLFKICKKHTRRLQIDEPKHWKSYVNNIYNYKW